MREELFPFVESEYRTEPYRIMVGPQAAAVFGVYALIEEPETFDAFILNDPCRPDAEGETLCEELLAFSATPAAAGKYLAVSHDARDRRWDMERLEALEEGFEAQAHEGFRWQIRTDPDWPFFLAPVDIRTPLLDLFADYPFPAMEEAEGLPEILDHYQGLSEKLGFGVNPPNLILTRVGAHLTNQGAYHASLEVLTHLVELYPAAMDGPWQLANLHREMGDTATAIRYYQECVRRDPNMSLARTWLQRLGSGGG
jgi:tetratricopeptide (TPR) repeat protein